jgi:hypothetical protein
MIRTDCVVLLIVICGLSAIGAADLVVKPAPKPLPVEKDRDLSGYWLCTGKVGLKTYECAVTIEKHKSAYFVCFHNPGGNWIGVGSLDGDRFSVGWSNPAEKLIGVTVYNVGAGKMTGSWLSIPGSGVRVRETMEFLRPLGKGE